MLEDNSITSDQEYAGPGMQTVWLVRDIDAFVEQRPSEQDHLLDISLTYSEWLAIYFDALSLDKAIYDDWIQYHGRKGDGPREIFAQFDDVIEGFPMLSRINEPYCDVVFSDHEIKDLRQECLRLKASTSNGVALKGLEKMLAICERAIELNLTVYFMTQ